MKLGEEKISREDGRKSWSRVLCLFFIYFWHSIFATHLTPFHVAL